MPSLNLKVQQATVSSLVSVYYSIPLRDSFRGLSSRKPELLIARTQGRDQFRPRFYPLGVSHDQREEPPLSNFNNQWDIAV